MTKVRVARSCFSGLAILLVAGAPAWAAGYQGVVRERLPNGAIGPAVPAVVLRFVKEDGSVVRETPSAANGRYQLALPVGRYFVTASARDFEDYSSAPASLAVTGSGFKTSNVLLRKPRVTLALIVRHADRDGQNDALTPAGAARAEELAEVAAKAGVTAIYSTNTVRTRSTAEPLARRVKLTPQLYTTEQEAADAIARDHSGDVVLVVGHSNTTLGLAEAILGQGSLYPGPENPETEDFDNLFVVAKPVGGAVGSVLNLQYGPHSTPDAPNLSRAQTTNVLLLRHAEMAGNALSTTGQERAATLAHAAGKAGALVLFAPSGSGGTATLAPIAAELGVPVTPYDSGNPQALVAQIASAGARTVVVAGDRSTLQRLVRMMGASPVPGILADEFDHLMVMVVSAPGDARLISLQYGAPSP